MALVNRKVSLVLMLVAGLAFSGCTSDDCTGPNCDPGVIVGDLQVTWSIEGSDAVSLCDDYGIDYWVVTAVGPETRQDTIDCYNDTWDTAGTFFLMAEGLYDIDIAAYDVTDVDIGGAGTSFDLYDTGQTEIVDVTLYPEDFPI